MKNLTFLSKAAVFLILAGAFTACEPKETTPPGTTAADRMIKSIDYNGVKYTFTYDNMNRLSSVTMPEGKYIHTYIYEYQPGKVIRTKKDADYDNATYYLNGNGTVEKIEVGTENPEIQDFTYNGSGLLQSRIWDFSEPGDIWRFGYRDIVWSEGNITSAVYFDKEGKDEEKFDIIFSLTDLDNSYSIDLNSPFFNLNEPCFLEPFFSGLKSSNLIRAYDWNSDPDAVKAEYMLDSKQRISQITYTDYCQDYDKETGEFVDRIIILKVEYME